MAKSGKRIEEILLAFKVRLQESTQVAEPAVYQGKGFVGIPPKRFGPAVDPSLRRGVGQISKCYGR